MRQDDIYLYLMWLIVGMVVGALFTQQVVYKDMADIKQRYEVADSLFKDLSEHTFSIVVRGRNIEIISDSVYIDTTLGG